MLESAVENPVVYRAEQEGFWQRKCQWLGRRSAPDRIFARTLRGPVWIEFKRPGGRLEYGQVLEIRRMRAVGLEVHVCDNEEEAMDILMSSGRVEMKPV